MQLATQDMEGRFVRLEPLRPDHRDGLCVAADDPEIWTFLSVDGSGRGFDEWFGWSMDMHASGKHIVFAVRELHTQSLVGTTSYLAIVPEHRRVEIGFTWYAVAAQGGRANPECKLLLLTHAFEAGANRVELKTDVRNARSRAAITKLGAREEGTLRSNMVVRGGRIRDDVYFSIIRSEWPDVRRGLEARLG